MTDNGTSGPWGPPAFAPPSGPPAGPPSRPTSSPPSGPPSNPAGPAGPSVGQPAQAGFGVPPAGPSPQMNFGTPEQPRRRRSKVAVGGALVGIVALGAAGVFAVGQFGDDDGGGAASPEAVGVDLMKAMEQEDVLGMVDLLLPGEREVFREPLVDIASELSRLDILAADASLGDLSGLDLDMADEAVSVEATNVDDIANITMSASLTVALDGEQLPVGEFITDLAGDDFDLGELDQPATTEDFLLPMTVVEEDGRWYLSVFHTAAESVRAEFGDPIPDVGLEPRGGDTPEGAVGALLDGVEQLDLGKVIAAINPDEAAALHRYAPLFLDSIAPLTDDIGLDWQVTRTEYDVVGNDSKRFVTITDLRIDGTLEGSPFAIELANGCFVFEATEPGAEQRIDTCDLADATGDTQRASDVLLGTSFDIEGLTDVFERAFADYAPPGLTVQEVDGQWFVSPIGSGFDQTLALLRALDRNELDELVDATTTFVEQVSTEFGELFDPGALGGDVFADDQPEDMVADDAGDTVETDADDNADVGADTDTQADADADDVVESDFEAEQSVLEQCYSSEETDNIIECLVSAVDAGEIPEYYVGVELRHPECGVADQTLDSTLLFGLSDEDYTATVDAAAECFSALIASGELDELDVPAEYLRPECSNGQNPWRFNADEEFFDDWVECIYS